MAADQQTCTLIKDLLSSDRSDPHSPGRELLEGRLRLYLLWKKRLIEPDDSKYDVSNRASTSKLSAPLGEGQISEALKKKDAGRAFASQNRRRVRGGAPNGPGSSRAVGESTSIGGAEAADPDDLTGL